MATEIVGFMQNLTWVCYSLVPRRSVMGRRAPGIHCLRMRGSPGFCGELRNYCYTSPCCMTVHYLKHGSCLYLQDAAVFNQAMSYALGTVGKPGMVLKDKEPHRTYIARMCLYGYIWPS